ncbi:MAG: ribonuclease P protein component [Acidobacteria bacterium]|nr:ribonuclease P protein component [Acidobacteriota bacterium]
MHGDEPYPLKPQGLPSDHRVRKRRDFERAYEEGKKVVTSEFALFARANGLVHSRIGITTTRKLGTAVTRNRARRLVREAYRRHRNQIPTGLDFVFVVRPPLLDHKPSELASILMAAVQQASQETKTA